MKVVETDREIPLWVQLSNYIHKVQRYYPVSNFSNNSKEIEVKYSKVQD